MLLLPCRPLRQTEGEAWLNAELSWRLMSSNLVMDVVGLWPICFKGSGKSVWASLLALRVWPPQGGQSDFRSFSTDGTHLTWFIRCLEQLQAPTDPDRLTHGKNFRWTARLKVVWSRSLSTNDAMLLKVLCFLLLWLLCNCDWDYPRRWPSCSKDWWWVCRLTISQTLAWKELSDHANDGVLSYLPGIPRLHDFQCHSWSQSIRAWQGLTDLAQA
jgi:hypothetical protein